jgi:hypothetical protein
MMKEQTYSIWVVQEVGDTQQQYSTDGDDNQIMEDYMKPKFLHAWEILLPNRTCTGQEYLNCGSKGILAEDPDHEHLCLSPLGKIHSRYESR